MTAFQMIERFTLLIVFSDWHSRQTTLACTPAQLIQLDIVTLKNREQELTQKLKNPVGWMLRDDLQGLILFFHTQII